MVRITREHAREFHHWWARRLNRLVKMKQLTIKSANRDLGIIRKLYRQYWEFEVDEMRENPFRNLSFAKHKLKDILHFGWIGPKSLKPAVVKGLNAKAILLVYVMIQIVYRPSELSGLKAEEIVLERDIPHLRIRPQNDRQLKLKASVHGVPLLGVSLEPMIRAPTSFPKYTDKGNLYSASLMNTSRGRGIFSSKDRRIY